MTNIRSVVIGAVVSAIVAGVIVSCGGGGGYGDNGTPAAATYTVGGTLSGATGTVVLKLNGGGDISTANGSFTFAGGIPNGNTFNVQVVAANQRCTVANGAGTMGVANITNVTVTCGAQGSEIVVRSTTITGAQENPPNASTATGVGGIIVDPSNLANIKITGGITFSGITPTAGGHHIHQAPIGDPTNNGPVIIGLTLAADGVTATVPPGTTLTQAQYNALLAGELYFNVHSANNICGPNGTSSCAAGEIRGQITPQGGVFAAQTTLNAAQEVPPSASTATGQGTLLVDAATRTILISYITHDVTNANLNAAHIHAATGPGTNGGVIIGFNQAAGGNIATAPAGAQMTDPNLAGLLTNFLYFNVHSSNSVCGNNQNASCAGGEIRGDITVLP